MNKKDYEYVKEYLESLRGECVGLVARIDKAIDDIKRYAEKT